MRIAALTTTKPKSFLMHHNLLCYAKPLMLKLLHGHTGVLLHHLETHIGIVVLITNKPDAIDTAFQRRIRFSMTFPMPDAALRSVSLSMQTYNDVQSAWSGSFVYLFLYSLLGARIAMLLLMLTEFARAVRCLPMANDLIAVQ